MEPSTFLIGDQHLVGHGAEMLEGARDRLVGMLGVFVLRRAELNAARVAERAHNDHRTHSSLGDQTPTEFRLGLKTNEDPEDASKRVA